VSTPGTAYAPTPVPLTSSPIPATSSTVPATSSTVPATASPGTAVLYTAVSSYADAVPSSTVEVGSLVFSLVLGAITALSVLIARRAWGAISRSTEAAESSAREAARSADGATRSAEAAFRAVAEAGDAVRAATPGLLEVRDSVHLAARRGAFDRRRTRVLFLVHLVGIWDSYHALVAAMAGTDDFEPIVASIPRQFRGSERLYGEDDVHRGLTERGVPHLRFAGDAADTLRLIKAIDPDVIFRQSQWDPDIPAELGTERLSFAHTCLVPYETMNIVANVPDGRDSNTAVDSEYHRTAWLVFCANDMMLEMAVRDGVRAGAQFRVVGHPKADHLRAATPSWPIPAPGRRDPAGSPRPGRVVWSAHHTIARGWTDFGAFHLMREEMLAWAGASVDTEFVFMPHPALLPLPDSDVSPISRPEFDAWMAAWAELPNTAVLSETEYGPTLAASDVMVTDGLSMLVEYQLFGKPLIFFEREGHRPFNEIGERVVEGAHTVRTVAEARELTRRFLAGEPDPLQGHQRTIARRLLGTGDSVGRILDVLRREIARERGEPDPAPPRSTAG